MTDANTTEDNVIKVFEGTREIIFRLKGVGYIHVDWQEKNIKALIEFLQEALREPYKERNPLSIDLFQGFLSLYLERNEFERLAEMKEHDIEYNHFIVKKAQGAKGIADPNLITTDADLLSERSENIHKGMTQVLSCFGHE